MNSILTRFVCLSLLLICLLCAASQVRTLNLKTSASSLKPADAATQAKMNEAYGKLPLSFEVNQGQADPPIKFISRGGNFSFSFAPTEAALQLRGASTDQSSTVRMKMINANPSPKIEGVDQLPGKSNYLIGNDPKRWQTDIPNFARVRYDEVWPGVDAVFYGAQQRLEYDFVIAPGADPRAIRLSFEGAKKISVDASGDLILRLAESELRQRKPVVYQEVNGEKRLINGRYVVKGNQVGFEIGRYDRRRELVIDPVLNYLARLAAGRSIAVDSQGNAYITTSSDSATRKTDILVTKLNATGTQVIFTTVIGGISSDDPHDLVVDGAGSVYLTGGTSSTDFPGNYPGLPPGASSGACFKSTDGAINWSNSGRGLSQGVISLLIDPNNPMTLYAETGAVTMNSTVYRSSDGGGNWTPVNLGNVTRAKPLAVLPGNSNVIFAGTSSGLRKSVDGGATWNESGLNVADINAFVIDPKNTLSGSGWQRIRYRAVRFISAWLRQEWLPD